MAKIRWYSIFARAREKQLAHLEAKRQVENEWLLKAPLQQYAFPLDKLHMMLYIAYAEDKPNKELFLTRVNTEMERRGSPIRFRPDIPNQQILMLNYSDGYING